MNKTQLPDLVAVARCKDCIKLDRNPDDKSYYGFADVFKKHDIVGECTQHNVYVRTNDYCSIGERKEGK